VEDSHAAIISKEMFDMVQQEFKNRRELRSGGETGHGKFSGKYPFSGMIICGECGETYRRHQQYNPNKKYYIWVCKRHENMGKSSCPAKPIKEKTLEDAFVRALNKLIQNKDEILEELKAAAVREIADDCKSVTEETENEITRHQEEIAELISKKLQGEITEQEYDKECIRHKNEIDGLEFKRQAALTEQSKMQLAEYRIEEVIKLLTDGKILQEFDKTIFKSLVRKMTVISKNEIEIAFECGITVRENLKP